MRWPVLAWALVAWGPRTTEEGRIRILPLEIPSAPPPCYPALPSPPPSLQPPSSFWWGLALCKCRLWFPDSMMRSRRVALSRRSWVRRITKIITNSCQYKSIIYLSRVLCLSVCVCVCVCVSQFVAERSAILLVLAIKLTKETRRRVWRGRDRDGEIGKRQIVEGGCEETFHCWSQAWETCRFTVTPAVALLNYISSGIFWRIFYQTGVFAGFSHYFCRQQTV